MKFDSSPLTQSVDSLKNSITTLTNSMVTLTTNVGNVPDQVKMGVQAIQTKIEEEIKKLNEALPTMKFDPTTLTQSVDNLRNSMTALTSSVGDVPNQVTTVVQKKIAEEVTKLDATLKTLPKFDAATLKKPIEDLKDLLNQLNLRVDTGQDQVKTVQDQAKTVQEKINTQILKVENVLQSLPRGEALSDIEIKLEAFTKVLEEIRKKTARLKFTSTHAVKSESPSLVGKSESDFTDLAPNPDIGLNLDGQSSRSQWFYDVNMNMLQSKLNDLNDYFYQRLKSHDDCGHEDKNMARDLEDFYDRLDHMESTDDEQTEQIDAIKNKINEILRPCD
jgi:predicted  nucleic acid-binding Zn-ribbon protein